MRFFSKKFLKEFICEQKCIPWKVRVKLLAIGDQIKFYTGRAYDKAFFDSEHQKEITFNSVPIIVRTIVEKYSPTLIVDIGCGTGNYLRKFMEFGVDVLGYDNSSEAIRSCKEKGVSIKKINILRDKIKFQKIFDLAICFEVAEHLPESASCKLAKLLSESSDTIIFTAAHPGQGGTNHINEQPLYFWINVFKQLGYQFDETDTEDLKTKWNEHGVVKYMVNNLAIFKNSRLN